MCRAQYDKQVFIYLFEVELIRLLIIEYTTTWEHTLHTLKKKLELALSNMSQTHVFDTLCQTIIYQLQSNKITNIQYTIYNIKHFL